MFKTETHLNVSEVSRCSHLTAEEIITLYHKAGYSTVFVTDHFNPAYFEDDSRGKTWDERVDWFMQGYFNAKKKGDELGMNINFAMEMHLRGTHNRYLLYGIDREVYTLFDKTPKDVYALAKQQGVTMVQTHPYRDGKCTPTPDCIDAIEVINHNPRHENFDEKAIEIAEKYNLPMTSGSDAHRPEDVGNSGVMTEERIKTTEDYISALLGKKLVLIRRSDSMIYLLNDLHGGDDIEGFEEYLHNASNDDIIIILGDTELNFRDTGENRNFTQHFLSIDKKYP